MSTGPDLEPLRVSQCVRLDDLPHVWLRVHQHEWQLCRHLAADGAQEQLDLVNECQKDLSHHGGKKPFGYH